MERVLSKPQEFAPVINFRRMPVVVMDLADKDEYGLKSKKVLIDCGQFRTGEPHYVRSEIRAWSDESKSKFSSGGACISRGFSYQDMEKMLEYANAPIVKKDQDILLCIIDSEKHQAYPCRVLHTSSYVDPFCSTPLTFTEENNFTCMWLALAGFEIK